jgi:hypothetical protein
MKIDHAIAIRIREKAPDISSSENKKICEKINQIIKALKCSSASRVIETVEITDRCTTITCSRNNPLEECFVKVGGAFLFDNKGQRFCSEVSSIKAYPAFFVINLIDVQPLKKGI